MSTVYRALYNQRLQTPVLYWKGKLNHNSSGKKYVSLPLPDIVCPPAPKPADAKPADTKPKVTPVNESNTNGAPTRTEISNQKGGAEIHNQKETADLVAQLCVGLDKSEFTGGFELEVLQTPWTTQQNAQWVHMNPPKNLNNVVVDHTGEAIAAVDNHENANDDNNGVSRANGTNGTNSRSVNSTNQKKKEHSTSKLSPPDSSRRFESDSANSNRCSNALRIVTVGCTHGNEHGFVWPEGDLLIHTGDLNLHTEERVREVAALFGRLRGRRRRESNKGESNTNDGKDANNGDNTAEIQDNVTTGPSAEEEMQDTTDNNAHSEKDSENDMYPLGILCTGGNHDPFPASSFENLLLTKRIFADHGVAFLVDEFVAVPVGVERGERIIISYCKFRSNHHS
jgi:hypothetical protein